MPVLKWQDKNITIIFQNKDVYWKTVVECDLIHVSQTVGRGSSTEMENSIDFGVNML